MKKIQKYLLLFVLLFSLAFLGFNAFKLNAAEGIITNDKILVKGASARINDPVGLRFVGSVDGYTVEEGKTITKYGIALAYGKQDATAEFVKDGTVGGYSVIFGESDTVETENEFYVTLIGIPTTQYDTYFTARAYVVLSDNTVVYASTVTARTLSQVCVAAKNAGVEGTVIDEVYNASETVLNLNNGNLLTEYNIKVSKYNADPNGGNININTNGVAKYNYYWYRVGLNPDEKHPGLYKVVTVADSGVSNSELANCEYVIAAHDSCNDKASKKLLINLVRNENALSYYAKINGTIPSEAGNCSLNVEFDMNPELLLKNAYHFGTGAELPTMEKDYYDFNGWCAKEDLSDTPVLIQGKDRTLYAKFTPKNYTITYELNEGTTTATLIKSYNYESEAIALPEASTMSKTDYTFGGWYDNSSYSGETLTTIPANSNGNKTIYAKWIANAPLEVALSAADKTAWEKINADYTTYPNIIVRSDFTGGKISTEFGEYACGVNAFPTVLAALSANKTGAIIYVFPGTYAEELNINNKAIICGPNYGVKGIATRAEEAAFTGNIRMAATGTVVNGIKLEGTNNIYISKNNCIIKNVNSTTVGTYANRVNGSNRAGLIDSGSNITNLQVIDSKFYMASNPGSMTSFVALGGTVNGLVLSGNYFELANLGSKLSYPEGVILYNAAGKIDILNNEFYYATNNWMLQIGTYSCSTSEINIKDNIFAGTKDGKIDTSGFFLPKVTGNCPVNFVHNTFKSITGTSFRFNNASAETKINFLYNNFDAKSPFNVPAGKFASGVVTFTGNYYGCAQTTKTPDYNVIKSVEELEKAYQAYLGK